LRFGFLLYAYLQKLRRPPEAHLDWGMKTPGGRVCFIFKVRMPRPLL
jgi:hypothetical protein